ncbi:hypothetical protein KP509_09G091100 [Ceratopteris richardii]|uniref:Protein kinase domain-containing protein n=1 Tax=Ceratopteris richardii TaxID=49495 RepID=A0A8T2U9I9_CERRI|nr:hypothetical protein KP509_09G091100 [Ceratopteris richardii]
MATGTRWDLQKATNNFTSKLGEGAFGLVFKATMPHGGTFAIKVLSSKSKQGEREFLTEVSDFGLSKAVSAGQVNAGIKGTFGYLDPEYISTSKYTLKSDVYSFGVLLFELVTARSPQKGLMDYVSLALLSVEGEEGWEEILDERIYGQCNLPELAAMANLAKQCVSTNSYDRPRMRDASLQLSKLGSSKFINQSRRNAPSDDSSRRDLDIGTQLPALLRLASIPEKVEV